MVIQLPREVDGHLRQHQIPVLYGMRPPLGGLQYTGVEQLP